MQTTLSFSCPAPARVFKVLGIIILVLAVLSLIGQYSRLVLGHGRLLGFVPEFALNEENNIPTYISTLLLLFSSLLLGAIAHFVRQTTGTFYRHWVGLALIFCYLSVDEMASLHEHTINPLRTTLDVSGIFHFAWVIPALALLAVFALSYMRFFWHLPRHWKVGFAASGLVYVSGGLGMELVGGWYWSQHSNPNMTYAFLTTIEEVLELVGVSLFVYTLLGYLRAHASTITLMLTSDTSETTAAVSESEPAPAYANTSGEDKDGETTSTVAPPSSAS
jgi:hypothetical protein